MQSDEIPEAGTPHPDPSEPWGDPRSVPSPAARPVLSAAERSGFPDWLVIYGWILVAFVLFQVLAAVVIIIGLQGRPGVELADLIDPSTIGQHLDLMFLGNSLGQVFAFGLLTLPVVYFVKRRSWNEMLPFRPGPTVWKTSLLAAVCVVVSQPAIWLLSWLNLQIPLPEFFEGIEKQQTDLIESFLKGDFNLALALFHVALVPAVCEEVMYRGFVLNMLRRTKAVWTAILVSGIIFGMYHLRLSQVIPLSLIGIFLGWITVRSGSLIPAMVAHFVNNGFSVLVVRLMPDSPLAATEPEMPPVWLALASIAFVYAVIWAIRTTTHSEEGGSHDWKYHTQ